ncbi:hypothetical protein BBO99_00005177 [Phytophthora kernoviae]|uniref:Uncharacterized protein n=1 Tax=Phytophthora kernoviae TaxID=325452 RepID=A0A421F4D6_9STRA|nr:hypothetical protein BBI17_005439 [Phytophthora kernoviae]RLN79570.1 hypothetical protein BBO99_00005177 [Phytophthora kernoviae]
MVTFLAMIYTIEDYFATIHASRYTVGRHRFTSELAQADYVNSSNTIGDATARDYVEIFRTLLEDGNSASEVPRTFAQIKDNVFRLEVSFQLLLQPLVIVYYSFDLEPTAVERIDRLESRMCDLQEELKAATEVTVVQQLQQEVSELQAKVTAMQQIEHSPLIIEAGAGAGANAKVKGGDIIRWYKADGGQNINGVDGVVRDVKPGMYQVMLEVCMENDCTSLVELKKNDECIQDQRSCKDCSAFLSCVICVEEGDQMTVACDDKLVGYSYLTLVRLGN